MIDLVLVLASGKKRKVCECGLHVRYVLVSTAFFSKFNEVHTPKRIYSLLFLLLQMFNIIITAPPYVTHKHQQQNHTTYYQKKNVSGPYMYGLRYI